ncbi:MAG: DnaJ domain-containing protein [Elusimicrobiota bacterium]
MRTEEAYAILGVEPGASPKEVQLAYRKGALACHPDRASSEDEVAYFTKRFLEVRDAYEYLRSQGFPVPEPQQVVEDPPQVRTAGRSFAPKEGAGDDVGLGEKLGLDFRFDLGSLWVWGILIPGGLAALIYFLKFLFRTLSP